MKKIMTCLFVGGALVLSHIAGATDISTGTTVSGDVSPISISTTKPSITTRVIATKNTTSPKLTDEQKKTILACVKTAALTRETSILTAITNYTTSMIQAFTARGTAITTAYDSGKTLKEMRADVKAAFASWRGAMKTAKETLKNARKNAWSTHKADLKACKITNEIQAITREESSQEAQEGKEVTGQ